MPSYKGKKHGTTAIKKSPHFGVNTLTKGMAQFHMKMDERFQDILLNFSVDAIDYMRTHAPWDDRTGAARAGLDGEVYVDDGEMGVILYHSADYGIWLETRWNGKFAIILPTVEQKGPELLAKMRGMMNGIIFYE